jgi:hypothetical protein
MQLVEALARMHACGAHWARCKRRLKLTVNIEAPSSLYTLHIYYIILFLGSSKMKKTLLIRPCFVTRDEITLWI